MDTVGSDGSCWVLINHEQAINPYGSLWTFLSPNGFCWVLVIPVVWILLCPDGSFCASLDPFWFWWILMGPDRSWGVLIDHDELLRVLTYPEVSWWVPSNLYWISKDVCQNYRGCLSPFPNDKYRWLFPTSFACARFKKKSAPFPT